MEQRSGGETGDPRFPHGKEATVFLSAGESSGDLHGARLAEELSRRARGLRLVGLGGSRMEEAGVELLADLDTLAVMGFVEVLRSLPRLLWLRRRVRRFLRDSEVDLVIPIDYPGFNLSLACHARKLGIPVLYYIAPQVWAWHQGRARRLARCTDRISVVLPFEKEFLESHGADAEFVGHPLLDEETPRPRRRAEGRTRPEAEVAPRSGPSREGPDETVLGLFPGSRAQEVERLLPPFLEAGRALRSERPGLELSVARAPDLSRDLFPSDGSLEVETPETVLRRASAALTKSGTITLQLALAGVPMVVGYRVNPITYWIARWLVTVDHVALVNLVAGRRLVPELLQDEVEPARLAAEIRPFLRPDAPERERMLAGLAEVRELLGEPGCASRVAGSALELLGSAT